MMVSTLQPPPRNHKKKTMQQHQSGKKKLNGALSSPTHGKKLKSSTVVNSEIAALYREDIGLMGVKHQVTSTTVRGGGPILKGPEGLKFQISETAEERLRRLRRKARFDAEGPTAKKAKLTSPISSPLSSFAKKTGPANVKKEPDFLSRALSAGRRDSNITSSSTSCSNSNSSKHGLQQQLVGTNQDLEKPYLRLTTYPKAENVRPYEVLIKSLAHIKSKYYQEEDFAWANEQLKSVRQDITVQRLRNRFVLDVYETHARILLEHGDLAEFNQCQTMIRYLTTTGIEPEEALLDNNTMVGSLATVSSSNDGHDGSTETTADPLQQSEEASDEFRAYHVLYALVQNSWEDLTRALIRVRAIIREKEQENATSGGGSTNKTACSRHSLQVVKSVTHNDYRAFFKLYESAPHMSAYLMDFLVKRMREKAYERIIVAYRPTICVEFFRGALCFHDIEETRLFLRQMGAVFVKGEPPLWVDCKASSSSK